MIYVNCLLVKITIYLAKKALKYFLLVKKVTIMTQYFDSVDIFSEEFTKLLPK